MIGRPIGQIGLILGLVGAWLGFGVVLLVAIEPAHSQDPAVRVDVQSNPKAEAEAEVAKALARGGYPWYDAQNDAFDPIRPPKPPKPRATTTTTTTSPNPNADGISFRELGRLLIFLLLAAGLTILIILLARAWERRHRTEPETSQPQRPVAPTADVRFEHLPQGLDLKNQDPWAKAVECRRQGDQAQAIYYLFAHMLLQLDERGVIRLAPGRTGRQLVRSIADRPARETMQRLLRLFEEVFYGHREPDPLAFEHLWAEVEVLKQQWVGETNR